jgi:hypothetical protein
VGWTAPQRPWLLPTAVVILAVIGFGCAPGVPLYDGVGFPDEPYRFVSAPAGSAATKPPTSAVRQVRLKRGASEAVELATGEYGPQCHVLLPPGALRGTAATASLRLMPRAPEQPPGQGTVEGNAYRIIAAGQGGQVTGDSGQAGVISLRALTAAQPGPVIAYRAETGAAWLRLVTLRVGQDVYEAPFQGLGEYLLIRASAPAAAPVRGAGGGGPVWLFAGVAAVGVLFLLLAAVVTRARGRAHPAQPSVRDPQP